MPPPPAPTHKPASSQCSDTTQVTSPAGSHPDSAVTTSSHEVEHKHLIKNSSEQRQAKKGQRSGWLKEKSMKK